MADTQTIKEHLKAIRDEIKTAGDKQDAEAKTAVRNALSHLEMARKEVEAHVQSDMTQDQADRKKMLEHMQTVASEGASALKENGAKMRTNIRAMLDKTDEILTKDV